MKRILISIIRMYQNIPGNFHNNCKFIPTCSSYAIEAIDKYGSIKGSFLSIKRIFKCGPWSKLRYDPVPERRVKKLKKLISLFLISVITLSATGCFKSDTMEDITIYTTTYPIEYITEKLYGNKATILSIYPSGIDVNGYNLTEKQIKDYSKASLFIFSGMRPEKDYVKKFFDYNNKIKIIDATASMEVIYRFEELWLNPSNLLMIAQNIKNGFNEYLTNHYIKNSINQSYDELKLELSNLDAEISLITENAENVTLIVSNNLFKFLSKYGFNVISLDEESIADRIITDAKSEIEKNGCMHIFVPLGETLSGNAKLIADEFKLEISYLNTLSNITEEERNNKKDYISIMHENIDLIKAEIYK